jgi:multidrug efflux pump subunit AcrA (membrane-fusion protein)
MTRARILLTGGAIALAAGAVAIVGLVWIQPAPPAAAPSTVPAATAEVVRGTLRDSKEISGTLGFGDPVILRPRVGDNTGIVTWLAPEGAIVERGQPLLALDGNPAILWYGASPLHRTLRFEVDAVIWEELEAAQDAASSAELKLELERIRLDQAESRLADAEARLADSAADRPSSAEFIDLAAAVHAADERLQRVRELSAADFSSSAEVDKAEAELAAARAAMAAATRTIRQQLDTARLDAAAGRVAVAEAEKLLRAARETLAELDAQANDQTDIELIADNLSALGFRGAIAEQVRAWQAQAGLPRTGRIEPGHVVVAERAVRIDVHRTAIGNPISETSPELGAALDYTSTEKIVSVPVSIADRRLASAGATVTVTLPDDRTVEGTITTVGTVVSDGTVEVEISIADQAALAGLEVASVDVEFVSATRDNVLYLPVTALLALPDGGFGVELLGGGTTRLAAVKTGLFAAGRVEVSGDGIAEGVVVGVPP